MDHPPRDDKQADRFADRKAGRAALAQLILAADLAGIFVFAIEGALTGIQAGLDVLGVLVAAFVASLGGGILRDLLIGGVRPYAMSDWRYPATGFFGGAFAFALHAWANQVPADLILALDAAGLGLFAVAGTERAMTFGLPPLNAVLLGGITGVGGGTMLDVLLARIPAILRVDIYATAALLAAVIVVAGRRVGWRPAWTAIAAGLACFALRLLAAREQWNLPVALSSPG